MTDEPQTSDTGDLVVECGLDAAPDKVWRALSIPELAADWLGAGHDPASHPKTTFEIVDSTPFTRLTYSLREQSDGMLAESLVTVEIEPDGSGATRFRLTHRRPQTSLAATNSNVAMALAA